MTKDEALTLALETLEFNQSVWRGKKEALTAIKKALAQPDAFEQGRQARMKQEQALWELSRLGQEIEAQPEQEPLAYAGVKVWVGNQQVVRLLTQTELHYSGMPWLLVELNAMKCVAALKEMNT